jgi:serine protease AprX
MRRLTVIVSCLALAVALLPAAAAGGTPADGASMGAAASADGDLYVIPFNAGPVDPARDLASADPADRDLVLVQWEQFGDSAMVDRIADTGATLVQALAPVNYVVWADAEQTRAIRAIDGIRFAGVLPPEMRVAASVDQDTEALRVTLVGEGGVDEDLPAAVHPRSFAEIGGTVVAVAGDAAAAERIAHHPRVYSVADVGEPAQLRDEQSSQIVARGTEDDAHAQPGYEDFLVEHGVDGAGVTVAIVDGGVDFNHPDTGPVSTCIDYGIPGLCELGNNDDAIGHGTHVLGVITGTGQTPFEDIDGFRAGLGLAPGADAVVQNAISLNTIPHGLIGQGPFAEGRTPVYTDAVRAGAVVSNNSWGPAGTPQGYDEDTREFDMIARDADPETPGDQEIALSWSIMNGGGGTSTQGSPDEAKNIIAVGGSGARAAYIGGDGHGVDDLCICTAHGPNLDGRQLVDIVAPAENVVSLRATQGALCGSPAGGLTPIGAPAYVQRPPLPMHGPCTGTSFASPHVTGAAAIFIDWYRQHVDADGTPSPALLKAAMVNTADDLSPFDGVDADGDALEPIPNDQQGWGRLNLGTLLDTWGDGIVYVDQDHAFTSSGESFTVTVEAIDPDAPLKATLAWTDAPGHGFGGSLPAWVNDLDLVVSDGDTTWLGNVFEDGWSIPGGERDHMNNLENVHLREASEDTYTVTVGATNILAAASPSVDERTWQDFALVITNAQLVDDPDVDPEEWQPGDGRPPWAPPPGRPVRDGWDRFSA